VRGFCVPSHEHPNGAPYASSKKNPRRPEVSLIRTKGTKHARQHSHRKLCKEQEQSKPQHRFPETVGRVAQKRFSLVGWEEEHIAERQFLAPRFNAVIRTEIDAT